MTSYFFLNIFINSVLAFFTTTLLIEVILFMFRVKRGRISSYLRMIPILKLPLDIFFYNFSTWAFLQNINPLTLKEGTRSLSIILGWPVSRIQLFTNDGLTFTVADIILTYIDKNAVIIFTLLLFIVTFTLFIKKVTQYKKSLKYLSQLQRHSTPSTKRISNPKLATYLQKRGVRVYTTKENLFSPFVTGIIFPHIYIPKQLQDSLSLNEYDSVIAHEIGHVCYHDCLIKLLLDVITTTFFYVPTKWLLSKIEEDQEVDCDLSTKYYQINPLDLATAIYKSAKPQDHVFTIALSKHKSINRIKALLSSKPIQWKKLNLLLTGLAITISCTWILLGRFWIF